MDTGVSANVVVAAVVAVVAEIEAFGFDRRRRFLRVFSVTTVLKGRWENLLCDQL